MSSAYIFTLRLLAVRGGHSWADYILILVSGSPPTRYDTNRFLHLLVISVLSWLVRALDFTDIARIGTAYLYAASLHWLSWSRLLPQRLFILCFSWFPMSSAYIFISLGDVEHSWRHYIYSVSTLYGIRQPVRNLSDYLGVVMAVYALDFSDFARFSSAYCYAVGQLNFTRPRLQCIVRVFTWVRYFPCSSFMNFCMSPYRTDHIFIPVKGRLPFRAAWPYSTLCVDGRYAFMQLDFGCNLARGCLVM